MRIIFALLIIFFINKNVFAQGEVNLRATISKIPSARIIDWQCAATKWPSVDKGGAGAPSDGWQEQALEVNDVVCCVSGECDYVLVALNRTVDNFARIAPGACLTIVEIDASLVREVDQNVEAETGEVLFNLDLLESGSKFYVNTPTATIAVVGTAFNLIVHDVVPKNNNDPGDYTEVIEFPGTDSVLIWENTYPDNAGVGDLDRFESQRPVDISEDPYVILEIWEKYYKVEEDAASDLPSNLPPGGETQILELKGIHGSIKEDIVDLKKNIMHLLSY